MAALPSLRSLGSMMSWLLPDDVDDVVAAGFAIAYGTAIGSLQWATRLAAGETLVVHGAAGGVGLATVECGKALGAKVIGTARGKERLEVVKAHGADHVIDTTTEDVRGKIKELTGGQGCGCRVRSDRRRPVRCVAKEPRLGGALCW